MRINGMKVIDAKRSISIHITPSDVKKGKTKNPSDCAAAVTIRREVAGCTEARVHLGRTYIKTAKTWARYVTPRSLRGEIIAFDRGGKFQPGEHRLRPIQPSARIGVAQGSSTNKTNPNRDRSAAPKRKLHVVKGVRQHGANR